jgi:capsular exopolysaccharide synthesis family protein
VNVLGVDRPLLPLDQRDWMKEFLPTQLGILQSRDLARMAHDDLKAPDGGSAPSGAVNASAASPTPAVAEAYVPTVGEIVAGRTVSLVKDSRLINIGFGSPDPVLAAAVANALARAYVQQNLEFRSKMSGDASDWLAKQVAQQRKVVEHSETALQRYRSQHGADALFTDKLGVEQQNIVVQKLAALQAAVTKARTDTIEKEALYRQLSATQAAQEPLDTLPTIASNLYIQGLKGELTTLQRQLVQASKELGDRHPEFIKLQGAVQNAEQKLQTEVSNVVGTIRNDFEATQSRERELTAALERQKSEVQALNGKAVDYTSLEREASSNREVLDKLLQRSSEATLARQLQTTNVRIVDLAGVPVAPVLPRTERIVAISLVASGTLALALVFVLEGFNTRVTSPEDVRRHLRIPVLGVVPEVKPQNGHLFLLLGGGAPARFAELFHGLRTNLLASPELATGRTLLVTSAEPAEGKTVSAANLAVSLAGLRQRVLLIDADLRRPRLHEVFGKELQPGLADVLRGTTTTCDFRKTRVPGLWLMPAGSPSQNPADLLGSEGFSKLIVYLREHFDWIVLDSPPVLAVTDPCLIARVASGVLLVVDCGHTAREVASAAVERLDAVGATLVGAMLNRVVLDRRSDSYLPYYHTEYKTYYPQQQDSFRPPEVPAASLNRASAAAEASTREG